MKCVLEVFEESCASIRKQFPDVHVTDGLKTALGLVDLHQRAEIEEFNQKRWHYFQGSSDSQIAE